MNARTRLLVLAITAPVIAFAVVGGFLGKVMAREGTYQHLKIFDDVVGLISSNYVEEVSLDKVMRGAMHGLADGLDADSAFLTPDEVKQIDAGTALPAGDVGLDLTRQYYLRVVAARDGSPAAKAGLRTGDYIRMIDDTPTREMSVWEGIRALRGASGSRVKLTIIRGNATDPHVVDLTREVPSGPEVTGRVAAPGVGYVRIAAFGPRVAEQIKAQTAELARGGAGRLVIDVRRSSGSDLDLGFTAARVFVGKGTLGQRETKGAERQSITAGAGDGAVTVPVVVLIDAGTSGPAELFAAALSGNQRAELVGEHTIGRAARQRLIKLPDGSGLWLSVTRYLTPAGVPLQEKGLEPTVAVEQPEVEFGQPVPAADPALDKALERLGGKKAA